MMWSSVGAFLMAAGVILGAFGAHVLRGRLDAYSLSVYEKAVFYHFLHALGILIVSILPRTGTFTENAAGWVCFLLALGIAIFSGSLYLLAISGNRILGAITPVGGVSMIAGWLLLGWYLLPRRG